MMTFKTLFS